MYTLIMLMDPSDLVNNPEIRVAVSKIITWCAEPKSVDVRKVSDFGAEHSFHPQTCPYSSQNII
jgi:hypothetical protein